MTIDPTRRRWRSLRGFGLALALVGCVPDLSHPFHTSLPDGAAPEVGARDVVFSAPDRPDVDRACGGRGQPCCASGACLSELVCQNGVCGPCPVGQTACSGACVSLASTPSHCGQCGNACQLPSATATCVGGSCRVAGCAPGYGDCDRAAANGCEVPTGSSLAHCGSCNSPCNLANATAMCAGGQCAVVGCSGSFANCDGNAANGCEVNTATDASHCGACGRACAAGTTCAAGQCVSCGVSGAPPCVTTGCGALTNCGGVCRNLMTDSASCGACGRACASAQACCGGNCRSVTNDNENCGACGNVCPSLANASTRCTSGTCVIGSCNGTYGDCDGVAANGCETNTNTATSHCGGCGRACALPNVATHLCTGGSCGVNACTAGFGNCDLVSTNGCEAALNTAMYCGSCGNRCGGRQTCATGVCLACGASSQPCCAGNTCDDPTSLVCLSGACAPCGAAGQPCCASNACVAGNVCNPTTQRCECGGDGQPCCATSPPCRDTLMCSGGTCA